MIRHYIKTAVRNLLRKKLFTAINIFGLATGLALCLLILGYISYETSFEDFHVNKDRIYRLQGKYAAGEIEMASARVWGPLGQSLIENLPEVESAAIFRVHDIKSFYTGQERHRIINEYEGASYTHGKKMIFAQPEYFDVFTFSIKVGNPQISLTDPNSVLITEKAAEQYFPDQDPLGQDIIINDNINATITGILNNIPQNTQLYCDFILSYSTLERMGEDIHAWDTLGNDYVYLLLRENTNPDELLPKIPSILNRYISPDEVEKYTFMLNPLKDIYFATFFSGYRGELYPGGEISLIYAFGLIALFILFQAITNFINLSTAQSADRIKEVGVRKVFGAMRKQLIPQYLGESIIITGIATWIGVVIYNVCKPWFQSSLPRDMLVDFYNDPFMLIATIALIPIVGILSGFYPALYLSRFTPISILQSRSSMKSTKSLLRRILVVFQFGVAVVFIFCATITVRQISLVTTMDMGIEQDNIIIMNFDGEDASATSLLLKNEILNKSRVVSATAGNQFPGVRSNTYAAYYPNDERKDEERFITSYFAGDENFLSMFGMNLVKGRNFSDNSAAYDIEVIITEAVVEEMKWNEPIGRKLYAGEDVAFEVVGVVKNFYSSAVGYGDPEMSVIRRSPKLFGAVAVKLPADDINEALASVKSVWQDIYPDRAFLYSFLDDAINKQFDDIRGQQKMFGAFAIIAISIACLGIFGLVSFTAEQRTKEIGIRKVLGATVPGIVKLLSREYVILVAISNIIVWPICYLMMSDMLSYLPVRVSLGPLSFGFVALVTFLMAMLAASYQSIKAANKNPIDALRRE
ncbi:MAG: ABC transporter permease [candidate division Zixibacteria bacterium]